MFVNQEEQLKAEFTEYTGKDIKIRNNSFYKTFLPLDPDEYEVIDEDNDVLNQLEIDTLRKEITSLMDELIHHGESDWNGNIYINNSFDIYNKFDSETTQQFFDRLPSFIEENILLEEIQLDTLFAQIDIDAKSNIPISITVIQNLLNQYRNINNKHKNLLDAYLKAVTEKLNQNFTTKPYEDFAVIEDSEDLPF